MGSTHPRSHESNNSGLASLAARLPRRLCAAGSESRCSSHTVAHWPDLKCFEQPDKPEQEQLSELPDTLDDPAYRWRKGVLLPAPAGGTGVEGAAGGAAAAEHKDFQTLPAPPALKEIGDTVALGKCPNRCGRARWTGRDGTGQGRARCSCGFWGWGWWTNEGEQQGQAVNESE